MRVLLLLALILLGFGSGPLAAAGTYELLFRSTALAGLKAAPDDGETGPATLLYDRVITGADAGQSGGSFSIAPAGSKIMWRADVSCGATGPNRST